MLLTKDHTGKKVRRVGASPAEGILRGFALSGKAIIEGMPYDCTPESDYKNGTWELVPEPEQSLSAEDKFQLDRAIENTSKGRLVTPAGLSLLEAMQSGKEFRPTNWNPGDKGGWMAVDHDDGELMDLDSWEAVSVTIDMLTARYELKPDPKKVEVTAEMLQELYHNYLRTDGDCEHELYLFIKKELGL